MLQPRTSSDRRALNHRRPFARVQYVVADPVDVQGISNRYDRAENPCQTGTDDECAKWLAQCLTEAYND